MLQQPDQSTWRIIGRSVPGAAHLRVGLPNQDHIKAVQPQSRNGLPLIVAVSDGHGSNKSFRSQVGAEMACRAAITELESILKAVGPGDNLTVVKSNCQDRLPRAIVRSWQQQVDSHLAQHPLDQDPAYAKSIKVDTQARDEKSRIAYGATLLAVAIADRLAVYVQIGDGNILVVTDADTPIPAVAEDKRLFANETTSLCTSDAWQEFRINVQVLSGTPPDLILLSTDGYANSFRDQAGFLQVGADLLAALRADGVQEVSDRLGGWLNEASQLGSGDDITVGLIYRDPTVTDGEFPQPLIVFDPDVSDAVSVMPSNVEDSVHESTVNPSPSDGTIPPVTIKHPVEPTESLSETQSTTTELPQNTRTEQ